MKSKKGFTLMELLIVVAIIAILVAVSIPIFTSQLEKTRESVCLANRRSALAAYRMGYMLDELTDSSTNEEILAYAQAHADNGIVCPSPDGRIYFEDGRFRCVKHTDGGSETPTEPEDPDEPVVPPTSDYRFDINDPPMTLNSLLKGVQEWLGQVDRSTLSGGNKNILEASKGNGDVVSMLSAYFPNSGFDEFSNATSGDIKVITTAGKKDSAENAQLISVIWKKADDLYVAYADTGNFYKVPQSVLSDKDYYTGEDQVLNKNGNLKKGVTKLTISD